MPEKKRIRKIWTGQNSMESVNEAIELLNTIKTDLETKEKDKESYYELIGIKIVYDVEE